jgi:hypothetical protein
MRMRKRSVMFVSVGLAVLVGLVGTLVVRPSWAPRRIRLTQSPER